MLILSFILNGLEFLSVNQNSIYDNSGLNIKFLGEISNT